MGNDLNEQLHPDYQKGFNDGYLIAEHIPSLAEQLAWIKNDSERITGMRHGIEQFNLKKTKDKLPAWLKQDRLSSLDKNNETKDKDKDDFEKE